MRQLNLVLLIMLIIGSAAFAQPRMVGSRGMILDDNASNKAYITTSVGGVGINGFNMAPNACAILDLSSQTKGFLPPRMVPAEIAALCGGTPPEGLIVYNTLTHTLDIWNGSTWTGQWQTKGNTNLSADNVDNLLGSTMLSSIKPFNLIVGGTRIMRYEINNRIQGGNPLNTIHANAHGATIAGGGQLGQPNIVNGFGIYDVIGGGRGNTANGDAGAGDATIGGGIGNTAAGARTTIGGGYFNTANVNAATIGGGANNTTGASAQYATIAGGNNNTNNSTFGAIGGGNANQILSLGGSHTIAGGQSNIINGGSNFSSIGGGQGNTTSNSYTSVGGGFSNETFADYATIGGGYDNTASGLVSTIGGGQSNQNMGTNSTIGGGYNNILFPSNEATIGGGHTNTMATSSEQSTIGGGYLNTVSAIRSTIGGGENNRATDNHTYVGGGLNNQAGNNAGGNADRPWATVGAGQNNTASGIYSSILGGANNTAAGNNTSIGGGRSNTANGVGSTIAGGGDDGSVTQGNTANGNASAIGGGLNNRATDNYTHVGGGQNNQAGDNAGTLADRSHATVAGGQNNTASGAHTFIGSGINNTASGNQSVIGGGSTNTTAVLSAIPGGENLNLGPNSFGFNAGTTANVSAVGSIGYFGNVNVWIGNTNNSARQVRFYENNSSGTYAGADYASFQAPAALGATTEYALPTNFGNAGGGIAPYILADVSGAGSPRQLTWISGNSSNWLLNGNSGIAAGNFIGTTDAADFVIKTGVGAIERMRFDGNPQLNSSTDPLIKITNTVPNQQGLRIEGTTDAIPGFGGSTLAANPGVWDLAVVGDAVVTGVTKMGSSIWFDGISTPHSIKMNQRTQIGTLTNNDLALISNNIERMYVDSSGRIGIGTKDPVSPLHIKALTPQAIPPDTNAVGFITPSPRHHVLTVENTYTPPLNLTDSNVYNRGNGIAIIIHNPSSGNILDDGQYNNSRTNYVTFYNDTGGKNNIRGRIEGFSYDDYLRMARGLDQIIDGGEFFNPFNWFKFNIEYDPDWIEFDLDFIHFTPPTFPTLDPGSYNFSTGSFPSISGGSICCYGIDWSGFSIDWPDISWPTLSGGSLPSLSITWPSLSGGSLPDLTFDQPVTLNGLPLTNLDNPFSLDTAFINAKVAQIKALPYKEKAADMVMNPVGGLVRFGASFAAGVTYESGSGDYAEWLERADPKEKIGVGDVVGVTGGKITKNTSNTNQYMVATWKPIVLGNMPEPGREADFTKVAFLGQIPVKIMGGCRKGDYILPSGRNDGFAVAISPDKIYATDLDKVLGVAWDDAYEITPRYVKIAVGLKPHEMVTVIQKQQRQIEILQDKVNEIDLLKQEMADLKETVAAASSSKVVSAKKSTKKPKFRYKTMGAK